VHAPCSQVPVGGRVVLLPASSFRLGALHNKVKFASGGPSSERFPLVGLRFRGGRFWVVVGSGGVLSSSVDQRQSGTGGRVNRRTVPLAEAGFHVRRLTLPPNPDRAAHRPTTREPPPQRRRVLVSSGCGGGVGKSCTTVSRQCPGWWVRLWCSLHSSARFLIVVRPPLA